MPELTESERIKFNALKTPHAELRRYAGGGCACVFRIYDREFVFEGDTFAEALAKAMEWEKQTGEVAQETDIGNSSETPI